MKINKILFGGLAIIFLVIIFANFGTDKKEVLTYLEPPLLKALSQDNVGETVNIEGSGFGQAKLLVFIDDEYKYDTQIEPDGSFDYKVIFDEEGEHTIKVKQSYENIVSELSNSLAVQADLTPPDAFFTITTSIPELTTNNELIIAGKSNDADYVYVNNKSYEVDEEGSFNITYLLKEGSNDLSFKLADLVGNETEELFGKSIKLDTTPPRVVTSLCSLLGTNNLNLGATEEYVCVDNGDFWGYFPSTYSMPIEGYGLGELYITIDGKSLFVDENNEIYKKVPLYLNFGTNKFKVYAKDTAGNESSKYLEINVVSDDEVSYDSGDVDYYINSDGDTVQSPTYYDYVPSGATAQCGDGTYSFSRSRSGTCSHHGGVATWY